jgi:uncharacterized protein (TIGR02246 family)
MSQVQAFDYKTAIQKAIAEFEAAAGAKSASRIAAFYADQATLLPPGAPMIQGRSNIERFWQGFLDAGAGDARLQTVSVDSSGELAYEIGTYDAMVPRAEGTGTVHQSGKYLVVWRRMSDNTIKMVADMFSANE